MATRHDRTFKGHLIVADQCHWWRTTDVVNEHGAFRISTIGDWRPDPMWPGAKSPMEIGVDRLYETMVFRLSTKPHQCDSPDCEENGALEIESFSQLDMKGYNTSVDAQAGHEQMVTYYMEGDDGLF